MLERIQRIMAALLHHRSAQLQKGDPLSLPLTTSTTYHLPDIENAPFMYGRMQTPTWAAVEAQLALLEEAEAVLFPSGMAAVSAALFATLKSGDVLLLPSDGYYVSRVLAQQFLSAFGVCVIEMPTADFASADFSGINVVYIETPTNPNLDVLDIANISQRCQAAGARLIVDNTTMTALLQQPLALGADLVVVADTKASAGHSDALVGHVAGRDAALMQRVRDWRRVSGAVPGSMEAWLLHRGLETLELRLARMCESAAVIAARLADHPLVLSLRYPGLPNDPSYDIARHQMVDFGFLIGMTLRDAQTAESFLSHCPFIAQATSFGGTHTTGERRARWGDRVPEGFVRLSIGVEPLEALWPAIDLALRKAHDLV